MKLQEASEEVTMELRDSSKLPTDTTTGNVNMASVHMAVIEWLLSIRRVGLTLWKHW